MWTHCRCTDCWTSKVLTFLTLTSLREKSPKDLRGLTVYYATGALPRGNLPNGSMRDGLALRDFPSGATGSLWPVVRALLLIWETNMLRLGAPYSQWTRGVGDHPPPHRSEFH